MSIRKIRIHGGPHGRQVRALVDGVEVAGVTGLVLRADVNDVTRLTTYQFVEADVEVEGEHQPSFNVAVRRRVPDGNGYLAVEEIAGAQADTIHEALYDCARQLELASREVAHGGTIEESGGRPPGH